MLSDVLALVNNKKFASEKCIPVKWRRQVVAKGKNEGEAPPPGELSVRAVTY